MRATRARNQQLLRIGTDNRPQQPASGTGPSCSFASGFECRMRRPSRLPPRRCRDRCQTVDACLGISAKMVLFSALGIALPAKGFPSRQKHIGSIHPTNPSKFPLWYSGCLMQSQWSRRGNPMGEGSSLMAFAALSHLVGGPALPTFQSGWTVGSRGAMRRISVHDECFRKPTTTEQAARARHAFTPVPPESQLLADRHPWLRRGVADRRQVRVS